VAEQERPCLAVDIGGTSTRVAVVRGMAVSNRLEMPTDAARGPDDLVGRLTALLHEVSQGEMEWPLGVSCTGRVDRGLVTAVNTATMPGWDSFPLQQRLVAQFGPTVHIMNDARAATLAEGSAWEGRATGNFLFVTVSTGIGSGLMLRGRLHTARQGQDIGLGFTRTADDGLLEHAASGRAFERLAACAGHASVRALFDAAEAGAGPAAEVLQAPLHELARHLQDVHCLLGLDRICLGGSVGLRAYTRTVVREQLQSWSGQLAGIQVPEIQPAVHGADAGLIGAALAVMEEESVR